MMGLRGSKHTSYAAILTVVSALCACSSSSDGGARSSGAAVGAEDVSDPKKAAAALLDQMGTTAIAQAKTYLEARDANIATWSQTLTPQTQEPYMGTGAVMPCFSSAAIAKEMADAAESAAREVHDTPGGKGGQAWFTPIPEPDPQTIGLSDDARYYDDSTVFASENAVPTLKQVFACAGIPTTLSETDAESNADRVALMANMKVLGTFAMRTAYANALKRYVTNVWMEELAGESVSDLDTSLIQNVVTQDSATYLSGVKMQLSPYIQTLLNAGATFATIAGDAPDGSSVPYQGFLYLDVTSVSLAGIDAGIKAKDQGTKSLLAAMGVLGGIPLMQQLVAPTPGKLTVVSSALFGNGLYFVAPGGSREFLTPADWEAQILALHDQFVQTLQQYYADNQEASSTMTAIENILESVVEDLNLDQTPDVQAVNSDYDSLTQILNQLSALGLPNDSYQTYANAIIQALQVSNDEWQALINQLDELIPDFDPIHGKFHLGFLLGDRGSDRDVCRSGDRRRSPRRRGGDRRCSRRKRR